MDLREIIKSNARFIQLGLFGLVVIYLSLLLPNKPGFNFHYEQGGVWQYDDLYAPATFGIKRNPEQMDSLKKLVVEQSLPYYHKPEAIRSQVIQRVEEILDVLHVNESIAKKATSNNLKTDILRYLDRTYARGVMENPADTGQSSNARLFYLMNEKGAAVIQQRMSYPTQSDVLDTVMQKIQARDTALAASFQPLLSDAILPNLIPDKALYQRILEEDIRQISPYEGRVEKGQRIVHRGEQILPGTYQRIESLRELLVMKPDSRSRYILIYLGNLLLMTLTIGLFYLYLRFVEPDMLQRTRKISFLLLWFILFPTIVYFIEDVDQVSAYIVPFCIVPIVIKNFMNERLAYITVIVLIMIASMITSLGLDYALLMVLAGLVAVLFGTETRYWTRFFTSIFIIFLTFLLGYLGLSLIRGDGLWQIDWKIYTALLINVVLTLLAYPIIPLLERLFGFTSSITLAELSDLNKPLLKKLSIKAPGTFHHSIQVSNLAEAAASKIGANSLLAKVGALYHDIGKMKNPMYFIENAGVKSLHDKIDPLESGRIILEHVTEGVSLAREYKIPQVVTDFIKTHHGTTRVEYFLHKYKAQFPQDKDAEAKFTYPGPRPKTREQSVVMLADSIEAASKTLKFKNYSELDAFVDKIIAQKLQGGQMDHSELSFEELEICRKVFKKTLRSIYHGRISYPEE
jgi:putative nucleotidyltransferase with HDIG domain